MPLMLGIFYRFFFVTFELDAAIPILFFSPDFASVPTVSSFLLMSRRNSLFSPFSHSQNLRLFFPEEPLVRYF